MIKAKSQTKDSNPRAFEKIAAIMKKTKDAYVSVGVHEGAGSYEGGQEVLQVALWNEFGTETIPSRPFFRTAIDQNEGLINQWREEMVHKMILGEITPKKALEAIGFRVQVLVQNQIKSNMPPPNAPSTIAHKAREGVAPVTLIETGLLLRSITFKVVGA